MNYSYPNDQNTASKSVFASPFDDLSSRSPAMSRSPVALDQSSSYYNKQTAPEFLPMAPTIEQQIYMHQALS